MQASGLLPSYPAGYPNLPLPQPFLINDTQKGGSFKFVGPVSSANLSDLVTQLGTTRGADYVP